MLRTTTHAVTSAHYASFLPDVGKRDVCIVFDFRRYQRDVFELTMHAHASVALDGRDTLVVLDGGGPMAERVEAIAAAVELDGAQVVRFAERDLGEPLSIFALTAVVQRIALDLAEARGTNPDRFRSDEDPGRERTFESIGF
jgi:DNA-binding MurR/RpiR family transcriptional regulator